MHFDANYFALASVREILVLRPGAIGDTLLTFPALRALRERFPEAGVTVAGNRPALELGRGAGLLDAADAFGADWVSDLFGDEPTPELRSRLERYDLAIVWMHSAESAGDLARMLRAAGVRAVLPALSFPAPGSRRHLADHLRDSLEPIGVGGGHPSEVESGRGFLLGGVGPARESDSARGTAPLVVLHPGAGARYKRWPAERYAGLARRYAAEGWEIAVTAGPADEEAVEAFLKAAGDLQPRVLQGLGLQSLASVLARASLVIGNDSGITHLAALVGAPTLALFGPYDPAYWAPIGPRVAVLDVGTDCPHRQDPREGCRGCNHLAALDVQSVWNVASRLA